MERNLTRNKDKTKKMIIMALFSAIIIVMTFVPYVGYISYGAISITTLHIPVIIGAIVLGPMGGLVLGGVWGVTCLLNALFINPIEGAIFLNPLISVVPRIIVGLLVGLLAARLAKVIKNTAVYAAICGICGTLFNTVLVLTAIGLFAGNSIIPLGDTLRTIVMIVVSINGSIEIIAAAVIVPVIVAAVNKQKKPYGDPGHIAGV